MHIKAHIKAFLSMCRIALVNAVVVAELITPAIASPVSAQVAMTESNKRFSVEDTFRIEGLGSWFGGPYAFSSDGRRLAITRLRPQVQQSNFLWGFLLGNSRADVWVQMDVSQPLTNITNGVVDGSGWWAPSWSPDGRRLAMVATRGGNVCVWIWDAQSRILTQVSSRGVDLQSGFERPVAWLDSKHIIFVALPSGAKPIIMTVETQTPSIATAQWVKAQIGHEPTASVLESGVPIDLSKRPQSELMVVDVTNLEANSIASGAGPVWALSPGSSDEPNARTVAYAKQTSVYLPKADEALPLDLSQKSVLALATTDGAPIALPRAASHNLLTHSIRWSPDGRCVAFLAFDANHDTQPTLNIIDTKAGSVISRSLEGVDATPPAGGGVGIEWTKFNELVVLAFKVGASAPSASKPRRDWWLTHEGGAPTALTSDFKSPPRNLLSSSDHNSFVALADGSLWRLDPLTGRRYNLTSGNIGVPVDALVWPTAPDVKAGAPLSQPVRGASYSQFIVSTGTSPNKKYYMVNLNGGEPVRILLPDVRAEVVDYSPPSQSVLLLASDQTGLELWRLVIGNPQAQKLFSANQFLKDIRGATFQIMQYKSLKGETLPGLLMLPPDFRTDKRYPMITWVYAGSVQTGTHHGNDIDDDSALNLQIAAAQGYVVLLPSMPLAELGAKDDTMTRLPEGVLPAVDRAIELGIADPNRLFLMGQSFGGFSTYGLVTQTSRFKAAVALAGVSDFVSLYGVFDASARYTDHPQEGLFEPWILENGQGRMGAPPWKDPARYYRNSPINFVEHVTTPLMIIQGDMDFVSQSQGEELFTALYRQGKRAEFVRYWGEGHVFFNPANIKDMWRRIFAWFDEFGANVDLEAHPGAEKANDIKSHHE